jgi:hypothetical protein
MIFRFSKHVGFVVCGVVALQAFACELPKLPVIPAADQIGDRAPAISEATSAYFDGIRDYRPAFRKSSPQRAATQRQLRSGRCWSRAPA